MLGSLLFLIHESWLNARRQGLMVLACISTSAMSLTILAVFILAAWHVHAIADAIPRRFEVHAFLQKGATRQQSETLARSIRTLPGVAQVRLVPREQAWAEFQKGYPRRQDLNGVDNPLPDKLEILAATPQDTLALAEQLRGMALVDQVREGREILQKLLTIANIIRLVGIALAALLALGTAAVISNAIRMTLYARRRDIRVMQLVGATNGFIRFPFVLEGIAEGAVGGALAAAVMFGLVQYLTVRVLPGMPFVNEFRMSLDLPLFAGVLVGGGSLLGLFGSFVSIRRFLHTA